MTTRLLPKSEVLAAKNAERKREIDEGAAMATKVDLLRRTALEEEAKLRTFREKNVQEATEAIKRKVAEHDCVQKKVEQLEKRKTEALKPLIEEEKRLKEWEIELNETHFGHITEAAALKEWSERLIAREKSLETDEQRMEDRRKRSEELLEIAAEKHDTANNIFYEAVQAEEKSKAALLNREIEVARLEQNIEIRELHIADRREQMDKQQLDINSKMTYIQDQYAVLERTAKELKQNAKPRSSIHNPSSKHA